MSADRKYETDMSAALVWRSVEKVLPSGFRVPAVSAKRRILLGHMGHVCEMSAGCATGRIMSS
jgi:hypothetical protein